MIYSVDAMAGATDRGEENSVTAGDESTAILSESEHKGLTRGQGLGRYIIVDELGAGGMGIVYSAFDPDLDRKVAVKLLRKRQDSLARSRLLLEAQAMAKLSHPNVVTVFEVDTDSGRDFIAMEYVDGMTLADWGQGNPSAQEVLSVFVQAGRGLAAAHKAGVVHRDFKPLNVLIDNEHRVRVTDFGLAYRTSEDESSCLAKGGAIAGTPAYMAPEQYLGLTTDARSDQFSFCVALYEALSGKRPFAEDNESGNTGSKRSFSSPPRLPEAVELPGGVAEIITRGMSEERSERFESMDMLLDALESSARLPKGRAWVIATVLVVLSISAMAYFLGASRSRTVDECSPDPSILVGSWDADIQSLVELSFGQTMGPNALGVYEKFAAILDVYAQQLVDMRLSICRASRAPTRVADELLVLQMSCLQKRKEELGAVTAAFSKVDLHGVDRAVDVARGLRDISDCADVDALQKGVAKPPSEDREEVLALQTSLEKAISQGEAGHVKDAIVVAEKARDRSLAIRYKPLQAEAYQALGRLYGMDLRIHDAELSFEESILAAEESGHTEYRARALTGITQLIAGGSSRFKEARRFARRANAAISQWGRAPELKVDVAIALVGILVKEGEVEQALDVAKATLEKYRVEKDPQPVYIAKLQINMSRVSQQMGLFREAWKLTSSSYQLVRDELGDGNIRTISYLSELADIHRMLGEYEQAHNLDQKIIAHWNSEEAKSLLEEDEDYNPLSRKVSGQVIDVAGAPVAGAKVVCGQSITADGHYIDAGWRIYSDAVHRKRIVRTDSFGNFACVDSSVDALVVSSDHPEIGRSGVEIVAAGEMAVTGLRLVLQATGFLSGTISAALGPSRARVVSVLYADSEIGKPRFAATTFVRSDNSYSFERLAPGRYKIFSGTSLKPSSSSVRFKEIDVVSGKGAQVDFAAAAGDSGISLQIQATGGAPLFSAQVLVVSGHVVAKTGKEFNKVVSADGLRLRNIFYSEGETLLIDSLQAGLYSVCLIPLGGDYRDPEYTKRFTPEAVERIAVYCEDIELQAGLVIDSIRTVPPWKPEISISGRTSVGNDPG